MRIISRLALLWVAAVCAGCIGDGASFQGAAEEPTIVTAALADGRVGAAYMAPLEAKGGTPPYAWSLSSGDLPPGLTLDSAGVLSGTPTSASDMDFSLAVVDSKSTGVRAKFRLRVLPVPVAITTAQQLPNGVAGTAYSVTLAGSGGTPPYRWQVTSGSLPAGLGLDALTGLVFGTPTGAVTASPTITLTDADTATASRTFALQIFPAASPTITTAQQLPSSVIGVAYSVTLTAAGGAPPYRWQVTAGALPAGLNLNQTTGVISGTPTSAVTATPTITVTDANSASASAAFSLRIFPTPPAITTAAQLANGMVGAAYSTTLAATGGTPPYRWQVTAGALPAGLNLNLNTGVISGTPTSVVTATPTITVTDANAATANMAFSLRINPAPIVIITAAQLPNGVNGTAYSAPLAATGGIPPYRWQVTAGSLPAGLTLDAFTGVIFGTPTSVVTASPTITVTDTNNVSVSAAFSLRINPPPVAISTAAQLPGGMVGSAYSTTLAATGGTTPYRWQVTAGALPAGLNLNLNTGVISGTPTGAGTANPTITVTDANSGSANLVFSLQIAPAPLAITTAATLPNGVLGTAYSTTLAATGGTTPYRWQVTTGTLPAGLNLNLNSGVISGTPTSAVTANVTITVTDANNATTNAAFSLRINPAAVTVTTAPTLPDGVIGTAYSTTLAATGGTTPYRWLVTTGTLPAGLNLNLNSGVISGTPTTAGTANVTITVTDANNASMGAGFSLRINPAPLVISTASQLASGTNGIAYTTTLAATGGTTPYSWQVTAGSLPAGLNLSQTTGVIAGTPTSAVTANATITVTDANNASTSATFALTINPSGTGWQLVWSDEFNGTSIDRSIWGNEVGFVRNNEVQNYTTDAANQFINNGDLVIKAIYSGGGYTSASLITAGHKTFLYGKLQARIKVPSPTGSWPAFWLLPVRGGWPGNGEIDILESVSQQPYTAYGSVHYSSGGVHASLMNAFNSSLPLSNDYHVYEIRWSATAIDWYVDDTQYGHLDTTSGVDNSAFTGYQFYAILNYAIGGAWAEAPNSSQYPGEMRVDWVRYYQQQ